MSDAYRRVTWRGRVFNKRTVAMLVEVERRVGDELTIFQGSYNSGVGASAGTHDGGGAVDLWCATTPVARVVRIMRVVGFAAWYRPAIPGLWGHHVHAIAIGDREMSTGARAQVIDYFNGRNGLASHAADSTWRPDPIPTFDYEKAIDVQLDDKLPSGKTVGEALSAVLVMQAQLAKFRESTRERDRRLRERINEIAKGDSVKLRELDALLDELLIDRDEDVAAVTSSKGGKS